MRRGTAVRFMNYETENFYGKIEKHLKPVNNINLFLINSGEGFYDCPQQNILLLDYTYEKL